MKLVAPEYSLKVASLFGRFLIGSLTVSEPEMTTDDKISDSLGVWEIRPSFRFISKVFQF